MTVVILVFGKKKKALFICAECLCQCIKLLCVFFLTVVTSIMMAESSTVCFYSVMDVCTYI